MNKIFSKGSLIIYGSLTLLVLIAWGMKAICKDVQVRATVHPLYVELGNPIHFSDSSLNVHSVTWDFGNGDVSTQRSGDYTFKKEGLYQVRLTIDNSYSVNYIVNVKEPDSSIYKVPIKILAPDTAVLYERVMFMIDGKVDKCSWEFGESGKKDSEEKYVFYSYSRPGIYEVKLVVQGMTYPVCHTIKIIDIRVRDNKCHFPGHINPEVGCHYPLLTATIQECLQKISDKKGGYNTNYHKVKGLLRASDNLPVLINETKEDRLDTYCKILWLAGKQNSIVIQDVKIEYDGSGKIKRLLITQTSDKENKN